ncbi:MAG: TVP38/TMEM64 family protein, partial [Candidatus Binatia bacterium]
GGSLLSALLTYGVGKVAGRKTVRRIAGTQLARVQRQISRHGFISVLAVRILPVAPFTVVNMVAGACQIHVRDFFLGTLFGMAPGILALIMLRTQLDRTLRDPTIEGFALLSALSVFFALAGWVAYRRIVKKPRARARS